MKRFLRRILILCLAMLLGAVVLDATFTRIFRDGRTMKSQWVQGMQGEHFDVVFAGSSRAYWNIDHAELGRICSMRVISIANSGYGPAEMHLALKMFLANGNTTDRFILQLDYRTLREQEHVSKNVYDFIPYLKDSLVYDHLRDRGTEWRLLRHIPFARYGRYNFLWGPEEALMTVTGLRNTIFDSTGSFYTDDRYRGTGGVKIGTEAFRPDDDILAMIDLCREHGIRVDLFMSPYYKLKLMGETHERFVAMLKKYDLRIHDLSDRMDSTIHFNDDFHLSRTGGALFTRILAEELVCPDPTLDPATSGSIIPAPL
jgi:hypothetical protein